jgi:hypothetical protein
VGGDRQFQGSPTVSPPLEPADGGDQAGGHTWTDLYRDYFGTSGRANCAGASSCHASQSETGYAQSSFLCPLADSKACHDGMTSQVAHLLTKADGTVVSSFNDTYLYSVLRKRSGGGLGNMPQAPVSVVFQDADLARIGSWFTDGAPDN